MHSVRAVAGLATLVALRLGLDASRLAADPGRYWNWEDAWNAAVGLFAWHGGLWDQVLALQYKTFCGGCTVLSIVSAPVLGIGGDSFVLWKGIALAWTAATILLGFVAMEGQAGRVAAWAFALLLAVPPIGLSDLSLMLWGNHAESGLFVLAALALQRRPFAFGVVTGLALWFSRTTLYAAVVLVPLALWRHPPLRVIGGFALGMSPMLLPAAGGDAGTYDLGLRANLFPRGTAHALRRLELFAAPEELAIRAFLVPRGHTWQGAAMLAAAGVGALLGARTLSAMGLAYVGFVAMSGVPIQKMAAAQGAIVNFRYHAPWFLLLLGITAAGAGRGIAAGGARRWLGVGAVALVLAASVAAWVPSLGRALPASHGARAVPHAMFSAIAAHRVPSERLERASSADPRVEATLRRMEGYAAAERPDAGLRLEGWTQAHTDPVDGWATLGRAQPRTREEGRGMAWNLGCALPRGSVADLLAMARAGLAEDEPCLACAAVGSAALRACLGKDTAACVAEAVAGRADAAEILYGAGAWCVRPGDAVAFCDKVARGLDEAGVDATPFRAGVEDPIAGIARPILKASSAGAPGTRPRPSRGSGARGGAP